MCGEIWYCRWACFGVYPWHGAIVAATVDTTVGAILCQTHGNRGREFDGISEANNTTSIFVVFVDVRKIEWRRYRGQTCHSVGKLLHFPIWNVSWLNSWKSNPMYNTHPKLYSKILGKKVRIISKILRYTNGCLQAGARGCTCTCCILTLKNYSSAVSWGLIS